MTHHTASTPQHFLGVNAAAEHVGLSRHGFLKAPPPQPDVLLDTTRGWSVETLDRWRASHPRRRQKITDVQREAMTNDLRAGRSIAEVAQAHQVSRPVVNKLDLARRASGGK